MTFQALRELHARAAQRAINILTCTDWRLVDKRVRENTINHLLHSPISYGTIGSVENPISTDVIERLIAGMRGDYTIVIVTHNLAQAQRIADDVAVFWCHDDSGCLIESGPALSVFASPQQPDTRAYLAGRRG